MRSPWRKDAHITAPADHAAPGVAIAEASRVLGVPMTTLRSWERRYDMPSGLHTPGRHRRYSPTDLHSLRLMRDQIARGDRASIAANSVQQLLARTGRSSEFVARILAASERSDPIAVRGQLSLALDTLGLVECLDDVLLPAMHQIGLWWATGRCDMDQEHLTTETARGWLETLIARAPPPQHPDPIVLTCGPSDLHTIGLEALTVLLRYDGRACRLLGARVGTEALVTAVHAGSAKVVVIVSHLSSERRRAVQSISACVDLGVAVFYAGNAFSSPRSRRAVPGTYLGSSLGAALQLIVEERDRTES